MPDTGPAPSPLPLVPRDSLDDLLMTELAAAALGLMRQRITAGDPLDVVVPEIIGAVFGASTPKLMGYDDVPGAGPTEPELAVAFLQTQSAASELLQQ
jgi:hypothetical protein